MTRALIVCNPVARHPLSDSTLAACISIGRAAGWEVDSVSTEHAGHGTLVARAAAERGVDIVIVHGGDGTLNEAINGLAGTRTAMAVLRGGTANVWAKETQCGKDPVAAMQAIVTGARRSVDLGRANGRYFLLMAGVGLDAAIVARMRPGWKQRLGGVAYVLAGVIATFQWRAMQSLVIIDGERFETPLYWLLAGNTRSYGGVANITHLARADDGRLEVALLRHGGPHRMLEAAVRLLFKRHLRGSNVRYTRATSIEILTEGAPVQIDGEPAGETPLRIEIAPLALDVIVPRDLESPLFSVTRAAHIARPE